MKGFLKNMKEVPGYSGYFVSKSGVIISFRKYKAGNMHKPHLSDDGYLRCTLSTGGGSRIHSSIHRIVAMAYVDNPNNLPEVNHIDGDKFNNHFTNLEWATHLENMQHANKLNLIVRPKLKDHGMAKLVLNTETGIFYDTLLEAVASTGYFKKSFLSMMLNGRRRNKSPFIYA